MERSHPHDHAHDQTAKEALSDEDRAEAVIDADDTGILGGERDIVNAEIERALERPDGKR